MCLNILNVLESKFVSGGLSKIETADNVLKVTVTNNGMVTLNMPWAENTFNMIFFHHKVTNLFGEAIFFGSSGNFTFNGYTFSVSPTKGGSVYLLTEPFIN